MTETNENYKPELREFWFVYCEPESFNHTQRNHNQRASINRHLGLESSFRLQTSLNFCFNYKPNRRFELRFLGFRVIRVSFFNGRNGLHCNMEEGIDGEEEEEGIDGRRERID